MAYDELLDSKDDYCKGMYKTNGNLGSAKVPEYVDAYDDKEFMSAFATSKLPVHQLLLVYEGWKLALENIKVDIDEGG